MAGLGAVLAETPAAHAAGGVGSEPVSLLVDLARNGLTFADWQR